MRLSELVSLWGWLEDSYQALPLLRLWTSSHRWMTFKILNKQSDDRNAADEGEAKCHSLYNLIRLEVRGPWVLKYSVKLLELRDLTVRQGLLEQVAVRWPHMRPYYKVVGLPRNKIS